ncbi:hypothetical protein J2X36_005352 [Methylobacterium sp. BE186]|uniref:hypothetical protein n=1 Tax=Methylobacterium sp. BE186 TaxID=2817715 RepID=UPI0028655D13|nr:hypothetical protein [Methylobacterium sp. BE186]MDR7040569.1 hypothetical protein [Methylobacterium sp. BE186]
MSKPAMSFDRVRKMSVFTHLKAKLQWLMSGTHADRKSRKLADDVEEGRSMGQMVYYRRNFEEDYNAASAMLKERMNSRYPNSFHARLGSGGNNAYDHGDVRSGTVDTVSTAIAQALRDGATVQEAAEAGAASIGLR